MTRRAAEEKTTDLKRRRGRKALWLGLFVVGAVIGGRWFWRQVQFSRLRVPLIQAVEAGDTGRVRDLLDQGADANVRMNYKPEPLTWAGVLRMLRGGTRAGPPKPAILFTPSRTETVLINAAFRDRVEIVQLLIAHGANVNLRDDLPQGDSALGWASVAQARDCVKVLLAHGAQVNGRNRRGYTPLFGAIAGDTMWNSGKSIPPGERCIDLLLRSGADVNARAENGDTPLIAIAGWAPTQAQADVLRQFMLQGLLRSPTVPASPRPAKSLLNRPASCEQPELVRTLLEHGTDVNAQDTQGKTALMSAVESAIRAGQPGARTNLASGNRIYFLATIQLLLDNGADIGRKDKSGRTALQLAESQHDKELIALLRKSGAHASRAGKGAVHSPEISKRP